MEAAGVPENPRQGSCRGSDLCPLRPPTSPDGEQTVGPGVGFGSGPGNSRIGGQEEDWPQMLAGVWAQAPHGLSMEGLATRGQLGSGEMMSLRVKGFIRNEPRKLATQCNFVQA